MPDDGGREPVAVFIDNLESHKRAALLAALQEVLARLGKDVCNTEYGKNLGRSLFEFRLRHTYDEIVSPVPWSRSVRTTRTRSRRRCASACLLPPSRRQARPAPERLRQGAAFIEETSRQRDQASPQASCRLQGAPRPSTCPISSRAQSLEQDVGLMPARPASGLMYLTPYGYHCILGLRR